MLWLIKSNSLEDDSSSGVIRLDGRLITNVWTYRPGPGFSYEVWLSLQLSIRHSFTSIKLANEYWYKVEIGQRVKRTARLSDRPDLGFPQIIKDSIHVAEG